MGNLQTKSNLVIMLACPLADVGSYASMVNVAMLMVVSGLSMVILGLDDCYMISMHIK